VKQGSLFAQGRNQSFQEETMSALERHQQAVDAFNAHDADAVADLYTADAILHDPQHPEPVRGRNAIREVYAKMFREFPDVQVAVSNRHLNGDFMSYELRLTGTNRGPIGMPGGKIPPTGRRIELRGSVFANLDASGRFRDTRRYYDVAALIKQLGLTHAMSQSESH
jgi:steroid delta-isomerase-like uncharacterized protein